MIDVNARNQLSQRQIINAVNKLESKIPTNSNNHPIVVNTGSKELNNKIDKLANSITNQQVVQPR